MLADEIDALAADFSGVVSVSRSDEIEIERAYGYADRAYRVPMTVDTRCAIASGTKAFTALAVTALIEDGVLAYDTPARSLLGADLPLIADDVTVAHLLEHTSGIGDYVDEEGEGMPLPSVPVQHLVDTADYLPALDGFPTKFRAGERFSYCNAGFVVLALLAERASSRSFHELVDALVCRPAGMARTAFPRADELPGDAARGYLDDGRMNVFHLPMRGNGDGGSYTCLADLRAFWSALFGGRILPRARVAELIAPQHDVPAEGMRYGRGFWLHASGPAVLLEGMDYGVSFRSAHDPTNGLTWSVIGTTSDGAWPIARRLGALLEI